ncbi:TIGR02302 family protein [Pseudochelatococcus sp. B33]
MSGAGRERQAPDAQVRDRDIRARLERAVRLSRASLYAERLWPRLWLPFGVAGVFVVVSWLGFWALLPAGGRMAGTLLFAALFVVACIPAIARRYPSRQEALRALDAGAGYDNLPDPASLLDDRQALGLNDPASRALWALHRRRAEAAVERLRPPAPRPETASYDYYGLRGALVVALVAAAFIAGNERGWRLALAFDWRSEAAVDQVALRVDGWIDPPAYTRLPPVMLDLARAGARDVSVPEGSVLVLRFAGQGGEHLAGDIEASGGLEERAAATAGGDGITERRYEVTGAARVDVEAGGGRAVLNIAVVPDEPPTIAFVGEPEATRRGGLTIAYRAGDDYGVTQAQGIVSLPGDEAEQTLVPAPVIALPLPRGGDAPQELRTTADLAAHPWAGAEVQLTLVARDAADQEGRSETLTVTLPQRPFNNPLARALVEQRRNLVFRPHDWRDVRMALRALRIAPELFTPDASVYLGLVTADRLLSGARKQEDLVAAAEFLWNMAVAIEDGDASDTEKALRAAQQALQEAIDRNAPPEEIARLAQELRDALNRHLAEMARNLSRNRDQTAQNQGQPSRTITPEELAAMIDRMERLAQEGDIAGAQQLMEQLRDILDNMQMAQGGEGSGSQAGEAGRAMRSLDNMIRNQQRLRDDTFRQNNELAEGGAPQQGGEPGQGQGPGAGQGQQGQQGQGGQQDLAGRQQALRRQLERLQQGLADQGLAAEPGLDAAGRAMRDAEERLGEGDGEGAVDAQGQALQALLNGAQGLAQQMQQAQQGENGEPGQQSAQEPGGRDPLGRLSGNRRWSDGDTRVPEADESAVARARRILDELRRRLGDPTRPSEERDYLERLLRRD